MRNKVNGERRAIEVGGKKKNRERKLIEVRGVRIWNHGRKYLLYKVKTVNVNFRSGRILVPCSLFQAPSCEEDKELDWEIKVNRIDNAI